MQATPEIDTKRLQLLKDAVPGMTRVAFLGLRTDWDNTNGKALRAAAARIGVTLCWQSTRAPDYANAFASMDRDRPDALFVAIEPASYANRRRIFDFVTDRRIPASYAWRQFVDEGGLMSRSEPQRPISPYSWLRT